MRKKHAKKGSIKYLILLAAVLACIPVGRVIVRAALENDNDASVRSVQVSDADIEESTLIVGSHLIHIRGLSESVYAIALESANEFDQGSIYYKSELADGQWYEITDASSIADITTGGTLVDKSVIEALEFTHSTDADGVTTDLRTGETVNIFDINSPYDLEAMEELEPIRLQYEMLLVKPEDNRTKSDEKYIEMIQELFAVDLRTVDCENCDSYLEALQRYREDLNDREAPASWTECVDGVMENVDASRRVMVYSGLDRVLDELLNRAQGLRAETMQANDGDSAGEAGDGAGGEAGDGSAGDGGGGDGGDSTGDGGDDAGEEGDDAEEEVVDNSFVVNSDIVAAIGESVNRVADSRSTYEAKLLTEGTTVISKCRYDTTNDLINYAVGNDYSNCDEAVKRLLALTNIIENKTADIETELALLENELVPQTKANYENALTEGASDDYVNAVIAGASAAAAERYLQQQKAKVESLLADYQAMLDALWRLLGNAEAQTDALERLDSLSALAEGIPSDDVYNYMQEVVTSQKLWLQDRYGELVAQGSTSSGMDALEEEKAELEKQYRDALDQNDLAAAALLEAQIAAVQADIDALEQDYLAILNSPNSSESEKARAAAGLGDGTSASAIEKLGDDFVSALNDADTDGDNLSDLLSQLGNLLSALRELSPLNPRAVASALDKIDDAVKGSTVLSSASGAAADAIQTEVADLQSEVGEAVTNSAGATMSAEAAKDLLDAVLKDLFGTGYDGANAAQKAEALLAAEWFGEETKNGDIAALAANMADGQAAEGSPYIYGKYTVETGNYVSLHAVGKILGYRVIFDNVHLVETLSSGPEYYTFTNGRKAYGTTGGTSRMMDTAAGLFERQLYIAAGDAKKIFALEAEEIDRASLSAAYTTDMKTAAEEILKALREGVG